LSIVLICGPSADSLANQDIKEWRYIPVSKNIQGWSCGSHNFPKAEILIDVLEAFQKKLYNDSLKIYFIIDDPIWEYSEDRKPFCYVGRNSVKFYKPGKFFYGRSSEYEMKDAITLYASTDYDYYGWIKALYSLIVSPKVDQAQIKLPISRWDNFDELYGWSSTNLAPLEGKDEVRIQQLFQNRFYASTWLANHGGPPISVFYEYPYYNIYKLADSSSLTGTTKPVVDTAGDVVLKLKYLFVWQWFNRSDVLVRGDSDCYYSSLNDGVASPAFSLPFITRGYVHSMEANKDVLSFYIVEYLGNYTVNVDRHSYKAAIDFSTLDKRERALYYNEFEWKTLDSLRQANVVRKKTAIKRIYHPGITLSLSLSGCLVSLGILWKINRQT
jgi:hypothetical protein